jgi:hypothetical protein
MRVSLSPVEDIGAFLTLGRRLELVKLA